MRIEAINAPRSHVGPESCATGVTAALAEARQLLRQTAPELSWSDVTARAHAVRASEPMTLLQALGVVFGQIADGK